MAEGPGLLLDPWDSVSTHISHQSRHKTKPFLFSIKISTKTKHLWISQTFLTIRGHKKKPPVKHLVFHHLHNPLLPFFLPQAHRVHSCRCMHTITLKLGTIWVSLQWSCSSPPNVCCSTSPWPPFSELWWEKFHNSQRNKDSKTLPKGTSRSFPKTQKT